jgi:hypothetical protein
MKGKFGIVALLVSSITFAGPVSAPNNLSDTPIISGGGTVSGGGTCRAYRTNGEAVPLSGGETLVFYGGGSSIDHWLPHNYAPRATSHVSGGFLSTKTTYSGTAYLQVRGPATGFCQDWVCWQEESCWDGWCDDFGCYSGGCPAYTYCNYTYGCTHGSGIGLFARNTTDKDDFIAGAGGSFGFWFLQWSRNNYAYLTPAAGGGWAGEHSLYIDVQPRKAKVGGVYINPPGTTYSGVWFGTAINIPQGFHGSRFGGGAASSISAFYNSYTKNYTSVGTSLTITGGGSPGVDTPTLYVCQ